MRLDPLTQPNALRQLFAAVFNRNADLVFLTTRAMRGLGFHMHADHAKGKAIGTGLHRKLQRRLGKPHLFAITVGIKIQSKDRIERRNVKPGANIRRRPHRIVMRPQHLGVIHQGDLLLGLVDKSYFHGSGAQPGPEGELFKRAHRVAASVGVRGLDHHHRIGVHRGEDNAQRLKLCGAGDVVSGRPFRVGERASFGVKQRIKPFDIISGNAHVRPHALR